MRGKYKYLISELGVFVFCYVPALIKITAVSSFKIRRLIDWCGIKKVDSLFSRIS